MSYLWKKTRSVVCSNITENDSLKKKSFVNKEKFKYEGVKFYGEHLFELRKDHNKLIEFIEQHNKSE